MSNSTRAHEEHRLRELQTKKENTARRNALRNTHRPILGPLGINLSVSPTGVNPRPEPVTPIKKRSFWQGVKELISGKRSNKK